MTTARPTDLPTTPPDAPRTPRTTGGRVLTAAGVAVAAGFLALGVAQPLAWVLEETTTATASAPAADVVELVADGQVRVTVADTDALDAVRVERVARFAWSGPRYEVTSADGRTVVRHECPGFPALRCSADLDVTVPQGTRVVVRAVDGDVRVDGPAGGVTVNAGDGEVRVAGTRGDVDLRGVDGNVDVADVRGDVVVHVSDGDLRVTDVTGDVLARGRDGATALADVGGDLDVRTTDGHLDVRGVGGALTARSVDGGVLVAAVRGDVTVHAVDGDVTVHGTGEPVALDVATRDGRQVVEGPTDPDADVRVELRTVDGDVAYLGPQD